MAFKELGGMAPWLTIWSGGVGSHFTGILDGVRTYEDRRNKEPKTKYLLTFLAEEHQGCVARARGEKNEKGEDTYYDVDVIPGEMFTLELNAVLEKRMAPVLKDLARYTACRFKITFTGLGEVTVKGRKPAKLYRVECDESTKKPAEPFQPLGAEEEAEE